MVGGQRKHEDDVDFAVLSNNSIVLVVVGPAFSLRPDSRRSRSFFPATPLVIIFLVPTSSLSRLPPPLLLSSPTTRETTPKTTPTRHRQNLLRCGDCWFVYRAQPARPRAGLRGLERRRGQPVQQDSAAGSARPRVACWGRRERGAARSGAGRHWQGVSGPEGEKVGEDGGHAEAATARAGRIGDQHDQQEDRPRLVGDDQFV